MFKISQKDGQKKYWKDYNLLEKLRLNKKVQSYDKKKIKQPLSIAKIKTQYHLERQKLMLGE